MVKKTFFIALSALLTSAVFLVAGEFTASVNNTQVGLRDSFALNLILKDSVPKEAPEISALKKYFSVHSQQLSTNTAIVNGKASSNITWKLLLTPKVEGIVQIPSITVDTGEGVLSTQPIALNVITSSAAQPSGDSIGLNLITKVSNASPYKKEPFIYTAILTSKMPLYNVKTEKMQVQDAIVEVLDEPKLEERVMGGVLLNVVEFTYLITPLKAGPLAIPPITIQAIPQKRPAQFGTFFNDGFDPFAMMQSFDRLKTFNLMTDEIQLDVQPAVPEISPWLPARALTLEEQWPSEQTLRVGEPFSRGFLIKAEGLKASQLPHLENLQSQHSVFKIYADKPEEQEKTLQGTVYSTRKEQYTIIPQQAGTWVLPEISISWWDSSKKEERTSTVAGRTVQILPVLETAAPIVHESAPTSVTTYATETPISAVRPFSLLHGLVGILVFSLLAALVWGFVLQRKIASLTEEASAKPILQKSISPPIAVVQKDKKERLPDLNPT